MIGVHYPPLPLWTTRRSFMRYIDGDMYMRYFAGSYDWLTALSGWRRKLAHHALEGIEPCLILDVGCGTGYLMSLARAKKFQARGVDPSAGMLRKARKIHGFSAEELYQSTADKLPFEAATFDFVVASGSLCYVPHMPQTAQEISRVLKQGGRLRIIDHAVPKERNAFTGCVAVFSQISGDLLHDYEYYFSSFCQLLKHQTLGRGGFLQQFDFVKN